MFSIGFLKFEIGWIDHEFSSAVTAVEVMTSCFLQRYHVLVLTESLKKGRNARLTMYCWPNDRFGRRAVISQVSGFADCSSPGGNVPEVGSGEPPKF